MTTTHRSYVAPPEEFEGYAREADEMADAYEAMAETLLRRAAEEPNPETATARLLVRQSNNAAAEARSFRSTAVWRYEQAAEAAEEVERLGPYDPEAELRDDDPDVDPTQCPTCNSVQAVVSIFVTDAADPTQAYRLACGHSTIDL